MIEAFSFPANICIRLKEANLSVICIFKEGSARQCPFERLIRCLKLVISVWHSLHVIHANSIVNVMLWSQKWHRRINSEDSEQLSVTDFWRALMFPFLTRVNQNYRWCAMSQWVQHLRGFSLFSFLLLYLERLHEIPGGNSGKSVKTPILCFFSEKKKRETGELSAVA